jgi:hypothetical protein
MNLTYIGNGIINISGCAEVELDVFYTFQFARGSEAYVCKSATKGILQEIMIKRVLLNRNRYGKIVPIYQDTLNGLYNEWDLCSQASAISLATAYYQNKIQEITEEIANSC